MHDHLIFQAIDAHTTILTPNRRLAATLHKRYQAYQQSLQLDCWETPDILPVTTWLERLYAAYTVTSFAAEPMLLSTAQERLIWESIVLDTQAHHLLLQTSDTADAVRAAWGLLKQWRLAIDHPTLSLADEHNQLRQWLHTFETHCAAENLIDQHLLTDIITQKIDDGVIPVASHLMLIGFIEASPQLNHLFHTCARQQIKISHFQLRETEGCAYQCSLRDTEEEILTMARFAKTLWQREPNARVGCVIPTLSKQRDRVQQLFSEVFSDAPYSTQEMTAQPFNISAGKSLAEQPLIHCALQLLALQQETISITQLSYFLTTPFLGDAETERMQRSECDHKLRQANLHRIKLPTLLSDDAQPLSLQAHCPLLAQRFRHFFTTLTDNATQYTFKTWAEHFHQCLTGLGWPGERRLNSEEYQTMTAWLNLLHDYQQLDHVSVPVTAAQALRMLKKMATTTMFQAQTPETAIQVLGILEAAGLPFDYLWVAGMDDLSWPTQPSPNPLLPKALQREHHMPHATAERERLFSEVITKQFKRSAKQVIFSYAATQDDLELQASALIRDLPSVCLEKLALIEHHSPTHRIFATRQCEYLSDDQGPPVTTSRVRGGMSVIKQQALCPFKAFAEWRLFAQALETPVPGLRPRDRGSLLHKALELIWAKLGDHETLVHTPTAALQQLITDVIDISLQALPPSQYICLEKKRLQQLLRDWLALEAAREPFVVIAREQSQQITLNQLQFNLKIDRIDELANHKKLIIDYKTAKHNDINSWFGERPDEPQLPLYALIDPEQTIAISFAQVNPGNHRFKGVSGRDIQLPGVKVIDEIKTAAAVTWSAQLDAWSQVLTQLSDDFCHGVASVSPKNPPETCTWCALKPLCRIHETITCDQHTS